MNKHLYRTNSFLENFFVILALGFLLNSIVPNAYFDVKGFELEEFDEREKEADEEKKEHLTKDVFNSAFSLINNHSNPKVLELYHRNKDKSNYQDHYYGVITPPPELV